MRLALLLARQDVLPAFRCLAALVRGSACRGIGFFLAYVKAAALVNAVVVVLPPCFYAVLEIAAVGYMELYEKCAILGDVAVLKHEIPDRILECAELIAAVALWRFFIAHLVD